MSPCESPGRQRVVYDGQCDHTARRHDDAQACSAAGALRVRRFWDRLKDSTTGELTDPMLIKKPKVAADEPMNFPSVAIEPLGPGPARTMDVRPKMKPMVSPTPAARQFRAPSVWDRLNP